VLMTPFSTSVKLAVTLRLVLLYAQSVSVGLQL